MPINVEQYNDESIISATTITPLDPAKDIPAMFAELTRFRLAANGPVASIIDVSSSIEAFSQLLFALGEASRAIKASKDAGGYAPILIFVGSGTLADIASKATGQTQYGGVGGNLCATLDEALALARERLSSVKIE